MSDTTDSDDFRWMDQHARRLREGFRFVVDAGQPVPRADVLAHVQRVVPPLEGQREVLSNGSERWENQFLWATSELSKLGVLAKSGSGVWSAPEGAKEFLDAFPDPEEFTREVQQRYRKRPTQRAWLVKGTAVLGSNIVPIWFQQGFASLAASQMDQLTPNLGATELRVLVADAYAHLKSSARKDKGDEIVAFVTQMKIGDLILTPNSGSAVVGEITGDWEWVESDGENSNLRRMVEWRNVDQPVPFDRLPDPLPARLQTGRTLLEITEDLALLHDLAPSPLEVEPEELVPQPRHAGLVTPPASLADELLVGEEWLNEIVELLNERRQLIFYGPPGTGKTYLAQKIANALVGIEQVKLVQFHPSYSYEDFFEGFRPTTGVSDGTIAFELRPGPLRRIVERARQQPELGFVLIIDEINRANLAKVFGELYFLLEYRDQGVDLLYSDGEEGFTLPKNLYLIGTMNTADRSIALVDAAMRRRFAFVPLDPAQEPTASMLYRWLKREGLPPTTATLLEELNLEIDSPELSIGPSYFMKSTDHSRPRLERVWRTSIEPLLEDHFFGQWESQRKRFTFDRLWARASGAIAIETVPANDAPLDE